jgi:putative phosphotransacetylase
MNEINIETSARHIHVSAADLEKLFGIGYELTPKKDLSQPGQYACNEKVTVKGPKGELKMSILGPTRKQTQVEISLTDARAIGLKVPIRESGDLAGSAACTIVGPAGEITIEEGVVAAKRHIHLSIDEAAALDVTDKQIVKVQIDSKERSIIFGDVVVRVNKDYRNAMHIDTDESNAACLDGTEKGTILK